VNERLRSEFEERPQCSQYITLVKLPANASVARFEFAGKSSSEPTTVERTAAETNFPAAPSTVCWRSTATESGSRRRGSTRSSVGSPCRLKKNVVYEFVSSLLVVQLELRTRGGRPFQTLPEVISYPSSMDDEPYEERAVEHGPINDVVYVEWDSTVRATAVLGAYFSSHGCRPVSSESSPRRA